MFSQTETPDALEFTNVRCAIYARYSSDLQRPSSIEDQIRQCRNYAAQKGWTIEEEFVRSDSEISGASLLGRDSLGFLVAAAKRSPRPFDALLIDDTSRFGRNLSDVLRIAEIINHYGVFLFFVSQRLDSRDPSFRQLLTFNGMIDEQYLVGLRNKVHRGQEGRLLNGYHPGGKCYGYRNVPIEDPSRRGDYGRPAVIAVKLEIVDEEAAIVRRIFGLYASDWGLSRIAKQLNKEGIRSPQPPRKSSLRAWCPSGIRSMLRNERYIGLVRWNRTTKARNPETGRKERRRRAHMEHLRVDHPELRIISDELWQRVQDRIQIVSQRFGNHRVGGFNRTEQSRTYLFSGLLRCGVCGANMTIGAGSGKYVKYVCPAHRYRGACSNKRVIRKDRLEHQLLSALAKNLQAPELLRYLTDEFTRALEARVRDIQKPDTNEAELRRQLEESHKQAERIVDAIASVGISSVLSAKLAVIEENIRQIGMKLDRPRNVQDLEFSRTEIEEFLAQQTADFLSLLQTDVTAAKATLQRHIGKLILTPKDTANGPVFEVSGDIDLFAGASDVMLNNPLEGIAQHYTLPRIAIAVVLEPSMPVAA